MGMTVADLRSFVRDHLDSDTDELPDSLLDVYRQEGTDRIVQSSRSWSFYETTVTFTTTANDNTYALSALSTPLRDIVGVEGPRWRCKPLSYENARETFARTVAATGEPRWYSIWADTLYLWPTPPSAYSMTVRGYRFPAVATSYSDEPDLPDEFHRLIGYWMLAQAYRQFDDEGMAGQLFGSFEQQLAILRERYESAPRGGISVLGGDRRGPRYAPGRLIYEWE